MPDHLGRPSHDPGCAEEVSRREPGLRFGREPLPKCDCTYYDQLAEFRARPHCPSCGLPGVAGSYGACNTNKRQPALSYACVVLTREESQP